MLRFHVVMVVLSGTLASTAQQLNYYSGNLHAHTAFSDGNKDSAASGVFTPAGSYGYAKASADLDFLGISEHNHYSSAHNPGFRQPLYRQGLDMADAANDEGHFVAMFGMEYGVSSEYNGQIVTYGFDSLVGWENAVPGVNGNNYDIYNAKSDYRSFFHKVKNKPGAFCYLAHPNFTDYSTNGDQSSSLAFAPYNPAFDSAIVGMPLRSGLATNSGDTYTDYPLGNYFNYYKRLLYVGYHLGIGYDHDNHYTNFGRGNGGRLIVIAPALTRAEIFSAMKAMHFYGSDDPNAKIRFQLDGNMMGSIVTGTVYPSLSVIHSDDDGENADTIKIWKGRSNSGGLWANIICTTIGNNTATYTDNDVVAGLEYYYFAEIRQTDGQWIVTSPVWFRAREPLAVREEKEDAIFTFAPNPVTKTLIISFSRHEPAHISITDLSGRTLLDAESDGSAGNMDIHVLAPGIYNLNVNTAHSGTSRKLFIE